jgi:biotin operon repressor
LSAKQYVTIQAEREYEIIGGEQKVKPRIYLKMYVDAVHDGLVRALGPELWQTLCVIAAFMDEDGNCYPSQSLIAQRLGVSRQTANARIKKLEKFRWNGQPIIKQVKMRGDGQKFENSVYTISPLSSIQIF